MIGANSYQAQVTLDLNSNYEHSFPDPQATDQIYSKVNVQNYQQGAANYYTNFYGYYETYGTTDSYELQWDLSGTYDFAGLPNHYLQFGVNTNPDTPLDVPTNGFISFQLWVNGIEVSPPGPAKRPGWVFNSGDLGKNLWHNLTALPAQGDWELKIVIEGATSGSTSPHDRFDAWLGVVDTLDIPAPGTMVLLGIAGIAGRKRRP